LVSEPGNYKKIQENIQWFLNHADDQEIHLMGERGREYLIANLTKDISIKKYSESIKTL